MRVEFDQHKDGQGYSGEKVNDWMNSWRDELSSPADSYIEWRFEHKCCQLSDGFRIINEWRTHKQHYTNLMKMTNIDFQHYSKHDATHSVAILETIAMLLGKNRVDLLSAGDLWLLLEAAYGHDTGMAKTYDEMEKLWEEDERFHAYVRECLVNDLGDVSRAALYYKEVDNLLHNLDKMEQLQDKEEIEFPRSWPTILQKYIMILVAEYIRKKHTENMRIDFQSTHMEDKVVPPRMYQLVSKVSKIHGRDFQDILKELKYSANGFGCGVIHPQFVAAMLRIGDLLDIDNNRFSPYAVAHFGRLPLVSMLHFEKHKSITHICVTESMIEAEAHTDDYEVGLLADDWFTDIEREVKELICFWNEIVPEALRGCTLKKSKCIVYLLDKEGGVYQAFDAHQKKEFTINKKKLIKLLIGTSIYDTEMEFLREYIQNAMDASKMQLWIDLQNGKYEFQKNPHIFEWENFSPFDLDKSVYSNYRIKIEFGWNANKDKISLSIIDQGIGIEKEYMNHLSEIGTGWKKRECYSAELKKMIRWLMPTGGFGIGIQSAFMVSDSVEILTKSDKDIHAYKVILKSPEKGGRVSKEIISNNYVRGTKVTIEIQPEKFQGWMAKINKNSVVLVQEEFEGTAAIEQDEFDLDTTLLYVQMFLEKYIKMIIPNSLFPIEIRGQHRKSIMHQNPFRPEKHYWESQRELKAKNIVFDGGEYLCIYNFGKGKTNNGSLRSFVIWDKLNSIFWEIHQDSVGRNRVFPCFKNILVSNADITGLEVFQNYAVCIDFMGFPAEHHLKAHRNSFDENFRLDKYCRIGFKLLLKFICEQDRTVVGEDVIVGEWSEESKHFSTVWKMFDLQLLRMIVFGGYPTNAYCTVQSKRIRNLLCYSMTEEEGTKKFSKRNKAGTEEEVIQELWKFYCDKGAGMEGILLNINEQLWYQDEFVRPETRFATIMIHPLKVLDWYDSNMEKPLNSVVELVLKKLTEGIGAIRDDQVIKMLLKDNNLIQQAIRYEDEFFLLLQKDQIKETLGKTDICNAFWEVSLNNKRRKFVDGDIVSDYQNICVKERPFQKEEMLKKRTYLLSPISSDAFLRVEKEQKSKKEIDYEFFRELVWGTRGKEEQSYFMLIDWVVKHQKNEKKLTKEEIIKQYERLLLDIYQICVHDKEYI